MAKKDVRESAKAIRKVLKAKYPGIKFSVRSSRFAGGSAVDVEWTDGPTQSQVGELTKHLKGYGNGYYNEYICTNRRVTQKTMEAAARVAAWYYGVAVPQIESYDGINAYCEDLTVVSNSTGERKEALCDKIHRAAHATSVYGVMSLEEAFKGAFPNQI